MLQQIVGPSVMWAIETWLLTDLDRRSLRRIQREMLMKLTHLPNFVLLPTPEQMAMLNRGLRTLRERACRRTWDREVAVRQFKFCRHVIVAPGHELVRAVLEWRGCRELKERTGRDRQVHRRHLGICWREQRVFSFWAFHDKDWKEQARLQPPNLGLSEWSIMCGLYPEYVLRPGKGCPFLHCKPDHIGYAAELTSASEQDVCT